MNITGVDVHLIVRDLPAMPRGGGPVTLSVDAKNACVIACVITTDEGLVGYSYGYSVGVARGRLIATSVKEMAALLIGHDPRRVEAAWDKFLAFANFLGKSGVAMMGMSILDMSMWDITCKAMNLPLSVALGGHKEEARTYSSGLPNILGRSGEPPSVRAVVDAVNILRDQGHTMVKAFISEPAELNLLRDAINDVGADVQFAVDVMHRWDVNVAVRTLSKFEDLNLIWVEDPIAHEDLKGLAHIADAVHAPICSGEDCFYIYEPQAMVDAARIRYLSIDLMRCGGITGWRKISAAVEGRGVDVVSHGYPQVALHLICGTRNAAYVEDYSMFTDVFINTVEVVNGSLRAPHTPGTGIWFSKEALTGTLFDSVR